MRSLPSLLVVSGAVLVLPFRSFQRANRSPLRTKISAPGGNGLVTCFLNTVPISYPFVESVGLRLWFAAWSSLAFGWTWHRNSLRQIVGKHQPVGACPRQDLDDLR